jgi:CheY-like chemotaxis protein
LTKKVLERQNYQVLEAKDGEEALSICQDRLAHIDLVVTDFAMPRMTGLQLREKIIALRPDMKFLLISGYAEGVVEDSLQRDLNGGLLGKTFSSSGTCTKGSRDTGPDQRQAWGERPTSCGHFFRPTLGQI